MREADDQVIVPDWAAVAKEAASVLATQSKDMEAAAALVEALVRLEGLAGLRAGVDVIIALVDQFWGQFYPSADPGEDLAQACLRPLAGLGGGNLTRPIQLLPFFQLDNGTDVTLVIFNEAVKIDRLSEDEKRRRVAAGTLTYDALAQLATKHRSVVADTARQASEAAAAWRQMEAALSEKAKEHKPPTQEVRERLDEIAAFARQLAPVTATPPGDRHNDPGQAAPPHLASAPVGPVGVAPAVAGAIASREEALSRLIEVAAWFRRTEPHSPLSYTLEEAVRRARMGLPDLLRDIVSDYGERARILTALGIRPPPETDE